MISYSDLENDLRNSTHNQIGKISSIFSVINRAMRIIGQYTDLQGTERTEVLVPVVGTTVEYDLPTTIKENAIISVFDADGNTADFVMVADDTEFAYYQEWNIKGFENIVAIKNYNGVKSLLIYSSKITPHSVSFYSNEYFLAVDGITYKTKMTASSDVIAIDSVYYESFLTTCELLIDRFNREINTGDMSIDKSMNGSALKHIWDNYPSNRLTIEGTY
jgi:hypothetical protein